MSDAARIYEPDPDAPQWPSNPEAKAWLDSIYADAADGTLWKTPPIREQLREHYKRVGLSD